MKKKSVFICTLLFAFLLLGMTACGEKKEQVLSGSYTSQGLLNQMNYTFDGENGVTVRFLVGGFSVYSQTGTYKINEDGSIITFSFQAGEEEADAYLPDGLTSLGGAFSFKQEETAFLSERSTIKRTRRVQSRRKPHSRTRKVHQLRLHQLRLLPQGKKPLFRLIRFT